MPIARMLAKPRMGGRRKHRKRKHSVHLPMSGEALARGFWVPFGFRSGPRALGGLELRIFVILGHFGGARSGYAALRCALGALQPVVWAPGRLPERFWLRCWTQNGPFWAAISCFPAVSVFLRFSFCVSLVFLFAMSFLVAGAPRAHTQSVR